MVLKKQIPTLILFLLIIGFYNSNNIRSNSEQQENSSFSKEVINPWTWQDQFGFVQGNKVTGTKEMLFTAGQVSVDKDGNLLHPNDMEKQINKVIDNLEAVINHAGFELSDIIKMTYYTTDVQEFTRVNKEKHVMYKRLNALGCKPTTSLIGINSLFHPDCVVEIEAVLAK